MRSTITGLLLAVGAAMPASAQSVLGTLAAPTELEVSGSISLVMDTARAIVEAGDAAPAPAPAPVATLRHLPATLSGWRITGESGALQWPVYVAAAEAPLLTRFRLVYRSAAAVLPETSTLTLAINDVVVGRVGIASPARIAPIEFDIPAGTLRPGFNAVRLSVEQRHGVDCSLDATYELWTDIIPEVSGFLAGDPAMPLPVALSDLAALRPRGDGALPIDLMVGQRMKPERVEQILLAVQAVARVGRFQMPVVRFASEQTSDAGLRLVIGSFADIVAANPSGTPTNGLDLVPGAVGRAPTLIISGATEADVAASLARLLALATADAIGTAPGLRAAATINGFKVAGGETVRLGDLGVRDSEFSGRAFRQSLTIAMPADFLPADSGKLAIDLAGGYAAGLKPDAQLRVEINGRNSASVNLAKTSGDVFRHNEILIPLGQLRPGSNRIEIVAQLATRADDVCESVGPLDREAKRFLLLASTEIRFPHFARVARSPDLRPFSAGAFPYAAASPRIVAPSPDRQSLSAAATLAARIGVAAEAIVPLTFAVKTSGATAAHTLVVAPARSLDPVMMEAIGLDPVAVRGAWDTKSKDDQIAPIPVSDRVMQRGVGSDDIVERWNDMVAQNTLWGSIRATTVAALRRGADRVADAIRKPPVVGNPVTPNAALIVAQGFPTSDSDYLVTLVTAPTSDALAQGVERLMEPSHWAALRGRLSVLDADGRTLAAIDAAHVRYVATQPASLGNARLVVAGWFSLNPMAYVAFVLILAGALAATTATLIRNVGRRNS